MPTYEYRCKECGHEFDVVQAFSDDALTVCTECNGPLKKVYGNVGISFKGTGFYKNDARGKSSSTTVASPDSGSSTTKADKSDATPAPKADKTPAKTKTKSTAAKSD